MRSNHLLFALLIFCSQISFATTVVTLSPSDIKQLLINNSPQAKQIEATAAQAQWGTSQIEKLFDFNFTADTGYLDSKYESLQSTIQEDKNNTLNLSLSKPFTSGTNLSLLYSRLDDDPTYPSTTNLAASRSYRSSTSQILGLSLQQNLWQNSFGAANRNDLEAAELNANAQKINRDVQLQNLLVSATKSYWVAVSAQETYQESIRTRDRYKKLIETVQRKSKYGYSSPGELAQAQAELEAKEQNINQQKISASSAINDLKSILGLSADSELKFQFKEDPPLANSIDTQKLVENSKTLAVNKTQLAASQKTRASAESKSHPDLSLVANYNQLGLDNSSSESASKLTDGKYNKYYVGLKMSYSFGSDAQEKEISYRRLNEQIAQTQLEIQTRSLQDQANQLQLRLQSNLENLQSTKRQKEFREKAMQEISKTYSQGRSDISVYIDSLNKYYDAHTASLKALADYEQTLSEWLALQDQLL